ncbi:hypothetical protein HMI54_012088 [Coelomomyces lativittatus]|nr:hypothetical protein HMI54_012088 [Coelomomyces lativittatus]KAJ1499381.1 hypothetical protein HMI55_004435 [Coelomomyces lativittatus]KAJ1503628.1 hypothetical protein HMI56_002039 [Coelomomyces lativittatus]
MASLNDEILSSLILKANEAKSQSYSPYSQFRVGCAVLTSTGEMVTGCNVENASYGGCICAERTALVKAVSEGHRQFIACCVTSDLKDEYCTPCGICRQFISEFGLDIMIVLTASNLQHKLVPIKELLPYAFGPSDLDKNKG